MAKKREDTEIRISAFNATKQAFDQVAAGLSRLEGGAAKLGLRFGALGGILSAGAFAGLISSSVSAIAALDDLSETTGLTVEFLSQLKQLASVTGADLDSVASAASKFAKSVGEARLGNKELLESFKAIGISAQDLANQRLDELFERFARASAEQADQEIAKALAIRLAGRSAAEQFPFFRDLAEIGLRQANITTQQTAQAEKLQNEFRKLRLEAENLGTALANQVVPILARVFEGINTLRQAGGLSEALAVARGGGGEDVPARLREVRSELEQLAETQRKLQENGGLLGRLGAVGTGVRAGAELRIQERRRLLEAEQRGLQSILASRASAMPPLEEPRAPAGGGAGGTNGAGGAGVDNARRAAEALARLRESQAKREVEAEKSLAQDRLRILESFYRAGQLGEEDYYARRLAIQEEATQRQVSAINEEIELRQRAVNAAARGTSEYFQALEQLEEALERRNSAEEEFGKFALESNLERARGTREYTDAVRELEARLADLEGRASDAVRIRQEAANRTIRAQASAAGDRSTVGVLDALERGGIAQARFNQLREQGNEITARLAIAEERVQNSLRTGAISEIEALRRTGQEREKAVGQLRTIGDELRSVAESSGLDALRLQAEQFAASLDTLASSADVLADKFQSIGEEAGAQLFEDLITKPKEAAQAFRDFADSIVRDVTRLASQDIAKRIFGSLGDGGGRGFGDIFARIFGAGSGGGLGPLGLDIQGLADGGSVAANRPYIVGERGPELFVPRSSGAIVPNGSMGGSPINISVMVPGGTDARSASQIASEVARATSRAMRRQ